DLMIAVEDQTEALWIDDIEMKVVDADAEKQTAALAKFNARLDDRKQHFKRIEASLKNVPAAAKDPSVTVGIATAKRFIDRVETGGPEGRQSLTWSAFQVEEVGDVLDETEKLIAGWPHRKTTPPPLLWPVGGSALIRNG